MPPKPIVLTNGITQGYSLRQIASILQVGHSTVGNDVTFLRQRAKENIKSYVDERLPEEYERRTRTNYA